MSHKYEKRLVLGRDETGRQIRMRIYADTKAELKEKEFDARRSFEKQPAAVDAALSFETYALQWLGNKKIAPATRHGYQACLKHCGDINNLNIGDVRKSDVQMIINGLWNNQQTAKKTRAVLRQIFEQAADDGLIVRNPVANLEMPKSKQKERSFLSDEQKTALKAADFTKKERAFTNILFYFGLRPGEALALRNGDFDFKNDTLTISRAVGYDKDAAYLKDTKTGNIRVLPVPTEAKESLQTYCKGIPDYLFSNTKGGLLCKASYKRFWKRIKTKWNVACGGDVDNDILGDVSPYIFRRTYATDLYYSGISIKKAAYLMGHSSTDMIIRIYAQLDDERENLDELKKRRL